MSAEVIELCSNAFAVFLGFYCAITLYTVFGKCSLSLKFIKTKMLAQKTNVKTLAQALETRGQPSA